MRTTKLHIHQYNWLLVERLIDCSLTYMYLLLSWIFTSLSVYALVKYSIDSCRNVKTNAQFSEIKSIWYAEGYTLLEHEQIKMSAFETLLNICKNARRHSREDHNQHYTVPAFINTRTHRRVHKSPLLDYVVSWFIYWRPISKNNSRQ